MNKPKPSDLPFTSREQKVVLLLSGGIDSSVLLAHLVEMSYEVFCLSVNYGQKHHREIESAKDIVIDYNHGFFKEKGPVYHQEIDIRHQVKLFDNSALTNSKIAVPDGYYTDDTMIKTVVPNRNMLLLSLAAAHAVNINAGAVAYACHAGDHAIYPDCRPEFIKAMREVLNWCSFEPIALLTPFVTHTKEHIVNIGKMLNVQFFKTWSCYKGGQLHCGACATCQERRQAFLRAGVKDLVIYENEGLQNFPDELLLSKA